MSLFDQLVDEAIHSLPELAPLRSVVEKELLHHDILREMSRGGFLQKLTFIGGTCLRACYGSPRLSEDLDFTGGTQFARETLEELGPVLMERLEEKHGLPVSVSEPIHEEGNVETWKVKIVTRPERRHVPAQRINIDICALPSYDRHPMMLRNRYAVDMGTSGLFLQAQSRAEIFADKIVAFTLRPNRLKNRDLWDIFWLHQQGAALPADLVLRKAADRGLNDAAFLDRLEQRETYLRQEKAGQKNFVAEMRRFLPPGVIAENVEQDLFWPYLIDLIVEQNSKVKRAAKGY